MDQKKGHVWLHLSRRALCIGQGRENPPGQSFSPEEENGIFWKSVCYECLEIGLPWSLGETNRDPGRGFNVSDLCINLLSALTGPSNETSSLVPSPPASRDFKTKDLGIGFLVSQFWPQILEDKKG